MKKYSSVGRPPIMTRTISGVVIRVAYLRRGPRGPGWYWRRDRGSGWTRWYGPETSLDYAFLQGMKNLN